jgi:NTP pyrophosphatase (non-canonical NTP hydrolase)
MRVYIAGPMSGYPDHNFPAFHAAAARLRSKGLHVISPAEQGLDGTPEITWLDCMRHDVKLVAEVDAVAVLPGWDRSRGASIEVTLARSLGLPIFDAASGEPVGGSLDRACAEAVVWAGETFPHQTLQSKANHLMREARELAADPTDQAEMADVLILLAGLASIAGVDLERAVREKLAILRTRQWGEPDADGVVEHVRTEAGGAR